MGPVETGALSRPSSAAAGADDSPREPAQNDPTSWGAISPFRRAHPWAAHPGGHFYFPSSCPLALRSRDLLYFATETEARATGRTKSKNATC